LRVGHALELIPDQTFHRRERNQTLTRENSCFPDVSHIYCPVIVTNRQQNTVIMCVWGAYPLMNL